jgi:phenylalanyl-tRNA synthetase alpha chain
VSAAVVGSRRAPAAAGDGHHRRASRRQIVDFDAVRHEFRDALDEAGDAAAIEALRVRFLGKKGRLNELRQGIDFKSLSPDEKREIGRGFNALKEEITTALKERLDAIEAGGHGELDIDVTVPVEPGNRGSLHPVTLVQLDLEDIFQRMGFMVLKGYEAETEHYNFDALNIPRDHPARDMQDTFWLTNGKVLRTHTSANQVRTLQAYPPPVRAVFPGKCFRYETVDASHENTFYQMEGLLVDREVSISHLIAVMKALLTEVFHKEVTVRLRPGFFPFVEPGFELDIQCLICGGSGCATCKQ